MKLHNQLECIGLIMIEFKARYPGMKYRKWWYTKKKKKFYFKTYRVNYNSISDKIWSHSKLLYNSLYSQCQLLRVHFQIS